MVFRAVAASLAVALVAALGGWYLWTRATPEPPAPAQAEAPPPAPAPAGPEAAPSEVPAHPIAEAKPDAPVAEPPPTLADSDKVIADTLVAMLGRDAVLALVASSELVRRFVATVDNLPRKHAPVRAWPVQRTPGAFQTRAIEASGAGDAVVIDPANARRYTRFVNVAAAADSGRLAALYVRVYPLLQRAYVELGAAPERHFNDRVIEAIDDALAAPEVRGPIALTKPWIMWAYADPQLESRSAGQKIMIRVGPENAARLKSKLRDLRRQLTSAPPKP
jgi:hypothetical protein